MKIKTSTTVRKMSPANAFNILDPQHYDEVVIVTSTKIEGKVKAVMMSFPRLTSIPMSDQRVKDAIKKCVDTTNEQLLTYLKSK
jgi:hypothetical protein